MQTAKTKSRRVRSARAFVFGLTLTMVSLPVASEDVWNRMEKARGVLGQMAIQLETSLKPKDVAHVDCAVIVPRFYRGANRKR